MSRLVPDALRLFVEQRAGNICEYCHFPQESRFIKFHVEHIISIKHGGKTEENNLALSCPHCNYNKGTDLGTFLRDEQLTRFFHPRKDNWHDHFEIMDGQVVAKTDIGEATIKILKFNAPEQIIYRKEIEE